MPAFNAVNHIAGPAILTFDSQVWYTEGDIDVDIQQAEWEPQSSRYGNLGPRIRSLPVARVSFKPDGQVTSGRASKAFPYTLASVGASVFAAVDKTLVIQTLAGQAYTFGKAALIQSPTLVLSASKTFFDGSMVFMCLTKTNVDPTTTDSFLDIAAVAFSETTFDETKILSPGYTAALGAVSGLTAIESLDGFRIELPIRVQELSVDRFGVIGAHLTGLGPATCRFTPAGLTEAIWLTLVNLDGASVRLPGQTTAGTNDLVISGTGITVTIPDVGVQASKLGFGSAKERLGEVVCHSKPIFTVGVPGSLLTITVS